MSAKPHTAKPRRLYPRGISAVVLLTAAFALHVASVLAPLITVKHEEYREIPTPLGPGMILGPIRHDWTIGLHTSHIKTVVPPPAANLSIDRKYDTEKLPGSCDKIHQMLKVQRAFFYVALGLCSAALLMAVLNMFGFVPSIVHWTLTFLALPFGGIGVLIASLIWKNAYCPEVVAWADRPGAKIGAATIVLGVAVILEIIASILTCALPKGPHDLHIFERCCGEKADITPSTPSDGTEAAAREPHQAEEAEMKLAPSKSADF